MDKSNQTSGQESIPSFRCRRRHFLGTVAAGGVVVGTGGCSQFVDPDDQPSSDLVPPGPTIGLETIAEGLTYPTDLAVAPEDRDRYFVTDQVGLVRVIENDTLHEAPFLDIRDRAVDVGEHESEYIPDGFDERGLLGIEFHPAFEENRRFYLRYSAPPADDDGDWVKHLEILSEFQVDEKGDSADPDSELRILEIPKVAMIHNAGAIAFGPDGYLYVPMGDDGIWGEDDRGWYEENAGNKPQDTTDNLYGSVLRIDVTVGEGTYEIPADNPLVGHEEHRSEYYAWGFRNPYRMAFDAEDLYVGDVGERLFDSVILVKKGGNYGWNVKEGTHCFSTKSPTEPPDDCPDETPPEVRGGEPLLDPIIEYPHKYDDQPIGSAVIGGHVYRGDLLPTLSGAYVFGDWSTVPHGDPRGSLFVARPQADVESVHPYNEERGLWQMQELIVDDEQLTVEDGEFGRYVCGFGQDRDGEMYVLTTETARIEGSTGEVHRIVPAGDE